MLLLCFQPLVCAGCSNYEVMMFQPRSGTALYLGSVANYTSYSNPSASPISINFLDVFFSPLYYRPPISRVRRHSLLFTRSPPPLLARSAVQTPTR